MCFNLVNYSNAAFDTICNYTACNNVTGIVSDIRFQSLYLQCNVIDTDLLQGTPIISIHGKGPLKGKSTLLH